MIFKPICLENIYITSNTKCLQGCGPTEIFFTTSELALAGKVFTCLSLDIKIPEYLENSYTI